MPEPTRRREPEPPARRQAGALLAREGVLGLAVYTCSPPGRSDDPWLGAVLLGCALAWSSLDGILVRARPRASHPLAWSAPVVEAVLEAVLLSVAAGAVARLLAAAFGPMPIGW